METLGMQHDGLLRSRRIGRHDERADEVIYELKRDEWVQLISLARHSA
jgi:RimJ/RimL family protein N-acetyltransferase